MDTVKQSTFYRSLAAEHPGVEIWTDDDPDRHWAYFLIASRFGEGNVRILARVRVMRSRLQLRGYDEHCEEQWTDEH